LSRWQYLLQDYCLKLLREKDDLKQLSRMAANTAKTFENTSRGFVK